VKTLFDAKVAFRDGVGLYCKASDARSSLSKAAGMILGSHPPIIGVDPETQVKFLGPAEVQKHLGIPLARPYAQLQAVDGMYNRLIGSVRQAAKVWSRFDLSPFGRIYIAKQVLSSTISYHAQFFFF
jgi:hypothetical protein